MRTRIREGLIAACSVALLSAGCTQAVKVPISEYDSLKPGRRYVIHTRDNRDIYAYDFKITSNSFVVTKVVKTHKVLVIDPMEIKFEDIESVSREKINKTRTFVLIPLASGALYFMLTMIALSGLS